METERRRRVLVVDDDFSDLELIRRVLEEGGYEVSFAASVSDADEMVLETLQRGERFDAALIDLKIGADSGAEFARRLKEIVVDIGVAIVTGHFDPAAHMLQAFEPDEIVIKTSDNLSSVRSGQSTLLETVERLVKPRRIAEDRVEVRCNRWEATGHLYGINSLRPFTRVPSGKKPEEQTEKFVSLAMEDGRWVNTVVYPGYPADNREPVSLQSTIGCNMLCQMCLNWRNQKGASGEMIPYLRALTAEELFAQVYLAMGSQRIKRLFEKEVDAGLLINFTGPGDGLVNNLDNAAELIGRLAEVKKPVISFVITSVGSLRGLRKYLAEYITLPRVSLYWSVNSLDPEVRGVLMPGTKNQSLKMLRDLYAEIAEKTERPVTASWALFRGMNDTGDEARRIATFFRNCGKHFRIKLMAGCPGSMPNLPDTTEADVIAFEKLLVDAGVDVRIRKIFGAEEGEYSGCGRTEPDFVVRGRTYEE